MLIGRTMEKENFYELINLPSKFSETSLEQIKNLIEKYPYFQGARALYLMNLKQIGDKSISNQIQNQASLVPNRQHLYRLLNPTSPIIILPETTEEAIETKKPTKGRPKTKKTSSEASFVLLEGQNHTDAVTINAEATSDSTDTDILELIDGDVENAISESSANSSSLIDAFLSNIPKIERPPMPQRGEIIENEDISTKSVEEPEELASEPLAQIYISQGYFEKALTVYEKLCLKYPEKSSYFADLIQNVKEQINSKH